MSEGGSKWICLSQTRQGEINGEEAKWTKIWISSWCVRLFQVLVEKKVLFRWCSATAGLYQVLLSVSSAVTSPVACWHMQWMAICLSSSSRMSKSRRGKMRRRDNVTGVTVRVVFLEAISQMGSLSLFIYLFICFTHFGNCLGVN